jgi:hypothetical protein
VGPRAVLDAVVKREIPSPRRESNRRTPIVQPVSNVKLTYRRNVRVHGIVKPFLFYVFKVFLLALHMDSFAFLLHILSTPLYAYMLRLLGTWVMLPPYRMLC